MTLNNIYYSPEKYGLQTIGEIELGGSYDFDTHVFFVNSQGKVFYAHDSGCSCPTPFDDFGIDNLTPVNEQNVSDLIMTIKDAPMEEKIMMLEKVRKYLQ